MRKAALLSVVTMVFVGTASVEGQVILNRRVVPQSRVVLPVPPGPYYPQPYYLHPHDPGNLRGQAAMIRARAEARRAWSQAERNRSEIRQNNAATRSRELGNRRKQIEQRSELKRQYQAKQAVYYAKKREARDRYLQRQRSKSQVAKVTPPTFAANGTRILCPEALQNGEYKTNRQKLDEIFQTQAQSDDKLEVSQSIKMTTKAMKAQLKQNIRNMSANDYLASRRFLDSISQAADSL